ncbi:MAG: glycosyltransferase [Chloroflexi bacterium]|nr:glycosyltransferase [Chloroflexota bacterium]
MVSKALVVGVYQRKLEEIARHHDVELRLVVPPVWHESSRSLPYEPLCTAGYGTRILPMRLNGHFHLHTYKGLTAVVREFQPDIIHLDEEPGDFVALQTILSMANARLLFFTWQNLLRWLPLPFRFIQQLTFRKAALALCGNRDAVNVLRVKGYRGRTVVLPQFGFDPDIYAFRTAEPPVNPVTIVGASGRLVPEKGFDILLRAIQQLPHNVHLELVGEGPERGELERLAVSLGIMDRLRFWGQQPSHAMPSLYQRWHVFVAPSLTRPRWKEQFNRSVAEAMSCGVPVIVSDSGEMKNVAGEAGTIVPEGDVSALSYAIDQLIGSKAHRQMASQLGRARVVRHYSQQAVAAQTVTEYRRLLCG